MSEEQVEEGEEKEPVMDSKGNRLDYEASAFARPRTKGVNLDGSDPLNDRTSDYK